MCELAGDHEIGAFLAQRAAEKLFVMAGPIGSRCIKETDADIDRPMKRRNRRLVFGMSVDARQAHAAIT